MHKQLTNNSQFRIINIQGNMRRVHAAYIFTFTTFHHQNVQLDAFSYVLSERHSERMQIHIDHINLAFLCCVFSIVSSKNLDQSRHIQIGYICLPFIHCEFQNVSSNGLLERMHNHIGYICLVFSTVNFKMCPQMACLRRCIITLVTFV